MNKSATDLIDRVNKLEDTLSDVKRKMGDALQLYYTRTQSAGKPTDLGTKTFEMLVEFFDHLDKAKAIQGRLIEEITKCNTDSTTGF